MRTERELTFQVLDDNNYDYNKSVVEDIIKKSKEAKASLIEKLRQMPGWNEEAQAVIFDTDIIRSIDPQACCEVFDWLKKELAKAIPEIKRTFSYNELGNIVNRLQDKVNAYRTLCSYGEDFINIYEETERELTKFKGMRNWYEENTFTLSYAKRISSEDYNNYRKFERVTRAIYEVLFEGNSFVTEDLAQYINDRFPDIKAVEGQKISKVVGKLCKFFNLNTIEDWRDDYNGNSKNYGYNYQFAKLGDSCNPLHLPRYVILSVNFVDYLYMSNGNSWGSCHTIIDGGAWGYRGEYSSGTISYALDPCSMIFYTIDKKYEGDEFCMEPKMQRAVMSYNDGVLYEGRVYPDGRDGGDQGYASQFRSIVQKLFADVEGKANLWKKVNNRLDYIRDCGGTAYNDWYHYDDTNVTTLNEMETVGKVVKVNAEPICILCGRRHDVTGNICCCDEGEVCAYCGERHREDDGFWIGDNFYCCDSCVYEDGYRYCDDIGEYVYVDECHEDDYSHDWFYRTDNMVETEDGHCFVSAENAINADYSCDDEGYWYPSEEVYFDEYEEVYFHVSSEDEVFEFNGKYYRSLENAKANGEEVEEVVA